MSIKALIGALALVAPLCAFAADSAQPLPVVSDVDVVVTVDFAKATVAATESLTIENTANVPLSKIPLNLNRLMRYDAASDATGPLNVTQEVLAFTDRPLLQVNHGVVDLREPLLPHARTKVSIRYSGYLVGYTETGSLYIRDTVDEKFTILRRDAYAFPAVETLTSAVNRAAYGHDFTFDARVTVPATHTVATGGHLLDATANGGTTTFHFRSDVPVPFLNIAIAKYRTLDRDGIRIYHFQEDAAGAARVMEKTERAIELLTKWFGALQNAPQFTIIEIPDDMGSQADLNAGVIQTASAFRNADSMQELYHELSHFWNVPEKDAPSSRWNEGLAMYLQRRMAADIDGKDELADRAAKTAARLVKMASADARLASVPFRDYGREQMTDYAYGTGFIMFYALEQRIGRDALQQSIREYFQRYKQRGAGFDEFMATAARVSKSDLAPFFDQWVRSTRWLDRLKKGDPVARIGGAETAGPE